MDGIVLQFSEAERLWAIGDTGTAAPLYDDILRTEANHVGALTRLGTWQIQQGQPALAVELLSRAAALAPTSAEIHNNLGVAHKTLGHWDAAVQAFQQAITLDATYAVAYFNLADLAETLGQLDTAATFFQRSWELDATDDECANRLLRLLIHQHKYAAAADVYSALLEFRPDSAEISSNLAYVLEKLGRLDEAAQAGERGVDLLPTSPECWNNLGIVYREQHRWDAAERCFSRAVALQPDFALAQFNLGTQHLVAGNYPQGWPGYEWRNLTLDTPPRRLPMPRWNGQPLPNQKLFVHCEQGLGDSLQWVRFLPELQRRSQAEIVLECPTEILPLLAGFSDLTLSAPCDKDFPACQAHLPLPSVPGMLGVTLADLPCTRFPYLSVDPERQQLWRAGLHALTDLVSLRAHIDRGLQRDQLVRVDKPARRVGLVWQGNRHHARDAVRSCPLPLLQPLGQVEGIIWYSLQRDTQAEQELASGAAGFTVISLEAEIHDLADRAAVICELDLVITVDTAVAHLAGALGVPTWLLLCHTPDWRWLIDRNDSPWYPTMRLFRQPRWGDWPGVIEQLLPALRTWQGEQPA